MKIAKMHKGDYGNIKAYFDLLTDEGITIKGFKLVDAGKGMFVGFPSKKGSDEEYHPTVWAEGDIKDKIEEMAKLEYSGEFSNEDIPF